MGAGNNPGPSSWSAGLSITKPIVINGVNSGKDARGRSVIGLGNAGFDNNPGDMDVEETNIYNSIARTTTISIQASDVTLDGLTITGNSDRSCYRGVEI